MVSAHQFGTSPLTYPRTRPFQEAAPLERYTGVGVACAITAQATTMSRLSPTFKTRGLSSSSSSSSQLAPDPASLLPLLEPRTLHATALFASAIYLLSRLRSSSSERPATAGASVASCSAFMFHCGVCRVRLPRLGAARGKSLMQSPRAKSCVVQEFNITW